MESWLRRRVLQEFSETKQKQEIKSFYASTGSGYISESWRSRSGSDRSFKRRLQACGSMVDYGY
ncbi:hypothetical protein IGI04_026789 [Brassica rapa subsp. trilocularis]|uniref:Uncharacterized protein n=1 Tax=Brassica rapa subsp. trilocularis TaxID=1813537 RepID=A0ABQ7KX95_BRACM|nr:hypothetical protein IGI04_026789 [Brassica rapa subsp. trilocularis]